MFNKILIRYGELVLKGKNRINFINTLAKNINNMIGEKPEIEFDRMFLKYSKNNLEKLNYVFGISSFSPVLVVKKEISAIEKYANSLIKESSKTFKVVSHRNDKNFEFNSNEINQRVGSYILKNNHLKVDVHNPNQIIYIEIRKNNAYVFTDYLLGLGGLPVGISGKTLHLLSGGIDSPIAAFKMIKRGMKVDFLSFITPPQTDEKTIQKLKDIITLLSKYQVHSTLYLCNYSTLMNYISLTSKNAYRITLMRRSFYRIASNLANKLKVIAISNGDNLGQVASQTLESLTVISSVITDKPIFRPLLTNDKEETIRIAKNINTYEISIQKANETCELFAPKEPVTKPRLHEVLQLEQELDMLPELEKKCLEENIEIIKF